MDKVHWQIQVPIFKNRTIMNQLGIAIGIPFGIIALIIVVSSGKSIYTLYGLGLILTLFLFTWFFLMLVYGGTYDVEFLLDSKGATCRTEAKQAKKNKIINGLTILLGFVSTRPGVAGAGMLAASRQVVFISWQQVTKINYKPEQNTILLRADWLNSMALFCTSENYHEVEQFVKYNLKA